MQGKEYSGETIEEALEKAASELGVAADELNYKVLKEGRVGIFGIGKRQVKIQIVDAEEVEPIMADEPASERPAEPAAPRETVAPSEFAQKSLDLVNEIVRRWQMDLDVSVEAEDDESLVLDIDGVDRKYLLSKDGQVINSLQYLVNIILFGQTSSKKKVKLNSGDYREKREQELIDRARRLAEKAKKFKEEKRMNYLNPYERRIVHLALNDDEGVTTFSVGRGFLKKVVIAPVE